MSPEGPKPPITAELNGVQSQIPRAGFFLSLSVSYTSGVGLGTEIFWPTP
jgi:hypothetical protein